MSWVAVVVSVVAAGTGACAVLLDRRHGSLVPALLLAVTSALSVATAAVGLHGTRWAFGALYSDSGFRTQAVTRYADSAAWADYGYRDLPAYYPPLWPWLQGRAAALVDVPAWTIMKPATLVAAAVIPVLSYVLWRRVTTNLTAAVVVAATTSLVAYLQKPDEWLLLACLLPWWLEVVRGVHAPARRPWRAWWHGLVLGVLLLTHTVYVVPLVVATVLGWATDLVRRRRPPLGLRDTLTVAGVALVVAAPYWLPVALLRLGGAPSDSLQLRWSPRGFDVPPLPLPVGVFGGIVLVTVVWLVLRLRSDPLAHGLALALVAGYAVSLGGQLLQAVDIALLPHKSHVLIKGVATVAVAAAVVDVARWALTHRGWRARSRTATAVVAAAAAACAVALVLVRLHASTTGNFVEAAHQTRYPDGSYPQARAGNDDPQLGPWDVHAGDPPVSDVLAAWRRVSGRGADEDSGTVLLTVRGDLLGTRPVHGFTTWKSIYSHPNGQYESRVELLREIAACSQPACAAELLTSNPYDRVDGVVARREGEDLVLPLGLDNFPMGWDHVELRIPDRLVRGPLFPREEVGDIVVARVVAPGDA